MPTVCFSNSMVPWVGKGTDSIQPCGSSELELIWVILDNVRNRFPWMDHRITFPNAPIYTVGLRAV
jgi:hypothetical protein